MNAWGRWPTLGLTLVLVLACLGCNRDEAGEPGIAATVNGAPISVAVLEARHDLTRLSLPMADNPAVEQLRTEYGAVLAAMIVARLADQELARHHLALTDAELAAAEAAIRADYPDDTFAAMLLEERIDLDRWREALRDHRTVEKFAREILRPGVRVGVTEAADYYKEHIEAFTQPARTRFLLVRATEAAVVKVALAAYRKDPSRTSLEAQAGVAVQEVTLTDRNLSKPWREALRPLKIGEASPVLADGTGGTVLVLLEHQGETVLEPATAYARVEAILSARKLEEAMAVWLGETLAKARIRVNPLLLAQTEQNQVPPEAPSDTPPVAPVAAPETAVSKTPPAETPAVSPPAATPAPIETAVAPAPPAPSVSEAPPAPLAAPDAIAAASVSVPASPVQAPDTASPASPAEKTEATPPPPSPAPAAVPPAPANPDASAPSASEIIPAVAPPPPAAPETEKSGAESGAVEFTAIKASWILYTADESPEERTYLKPGKPLRLTFSRRLVVRLGSPSEVSYKAGARENTVLVGKKESRTLEFP
jgi:hypothetical protein